MLCKKDVESILTAKKIPNWFYYISVIVAFLFIIYISIYVAITYDDIKYMNIAIVFIIITFVSFFVISGVYFQTKKMGYHSLASGLFFGGMLSLIIYTFAAVNASDIVRYSIIYAIIVTGISLFTLLPKKETPKIAQKAPARKLNLLK